MLLGALGALIAWGIAALILKGGASTSRLALAFTAGFVVSLALSWVGAVLLVGPGAIPIGGIVGALVGAAGACTMAWKKRAATPSA